jgi:hypothetical protein
MTDLQADWVGDDARLFLSQWTDRYRPFLQSLADTIDRLVRTTETNISEQKKTSQQTY